MENKKEIKTLSISAKSFFISLSIILALVIISYVLTFFVPSGSFQRVVNDAGESIIFTDDSNPYGVYNEVSRDFPFWKFLLSPFLCLGSSDGLMIIAIIVFLMVIGGVFAILTKRGIIKYLLDLLVSKFYKKRFILLLILPLFFMLLSTFAGCFEEIVPLVPIMVALAVSLGWDNVTGLCLSLFASGCGFAAGIMNPFGTGIAQRVAGAVAFSGVWMRIVSFIVFYLVLVAYLIIHTKRYERKHPMDISQVNQDFQKDEKLNKGLITFGSVLGVGIVVIICSTFITFLQDYTLYVFALCFLIGGFGACIVSKMNGKEMMKTFIKGAIDILPAAVMILFASAIKYILVESSTIDTLVKYLIEFAITIPKWSIVLFIYLIVLLIEFFVPSGSAKAFLIIPLLIPVTTLMGVPVNLIILAYIFGDGLANVIYPTNPALLIALNMADTNYAKYMKNIWPLVIGLFVSSTLLLFFAYFVGYC